MSLASTITRPVKYVYQHRPSASRRTGAPGEIGGYGSGLDPNGRSMHYSGSGLNQPKASRYQISNADTTQTKEPRVATGAEAQPESNYLKLARHLRELQSTPVTDKNGRLRSGAAQLRPTQASTPGQAIGQKVGQFLYGVLRPKADEEEARQEEIGKTEKQLSYQFALNKEQRETEESRANVGLTKAKTINEEGEPAAKQAEAQRKAREAVTAEDDKERDRILRTVNDAPEFDPTAQDGNTQAIVQRARELGMTLLKKERGQQMAIDSNSGRIYLHDGRGNVVEARNPKTGQPYNVSKPRELKLDDLPDSLFGLPDEKMMVDEARAQVEPTMKGRRIKPEILSGSWTDSEKVKHPFANPDGTPNMDEIWRAIDLQTISPSDVWENVTERDEQRLAAVRKDIRSRVTSDRALVDDFRLRLTRNKPIESAVATPVANVVKRFNEIRRMPVGKARDKALSDFYDTLPYLNIQ